MKYNGSLEKVNPKVGNGKSLPKTVFGMPNIIIIIYFKHILEKYNLRT